MNTPSQTMAMFDTAKQVAYPLAGILFGLWLLSRIIHAIRPGSQTTPLRGPPSKNLLFGLSNYMRKSPDTSVIHEGWTEEYGSVYAVPTSLGSTLVMLADPKAIASFFAQGTVTYVRSPGGRKFMKNLVCLLRPSVTLSQWLD
jgi:hypothetical protein